MPEVRCAAIGEVRTDLWFPSQGAPKDSLQPVPSASGHGRSLKASPAGARQRSERAGPEGIERQVRLTDKERPEERPDNRRNHGKPRRRLRQVTPSSQPPKPLHLQNKQSHLILFHTHPPLYFYESAEDVRGVVR